MSIARFLAKQFHLASKNNFEQPKVDAVADTVGDSLAKLVSAYAEQHETKKQELMQKFFGEELPQLLKNLEVLGKLYGNNGPYFVGNNLTWADLLFYTILENMISLMPDCLNNYPWLKQNRAEVGKQPRISKYIKNRSETDY